MQKLLELTLEIVISAVVSGDHMTETPENLGLKAAGFLGSGFLMFQGGGLKLLRLLN